MYAKHGIPVFPCNSNKRPITEKGFLDATTEPSQIKSWWRKNPNFLIGTPNTSFTVLDLDDHSICPASRLLSDNAINRVFALADLRDCVVVTTISGGRHFYFKRTPGATRKIKILPNVDLLGEGGFVILPDQKKYVASSPLWENLEKLPEFPLEAFNKLAIEMQPSVRLARDLNKSHKTGVPLQVKDEPKIRPEMTAAPKIADISEKKESINYKTGEICFEQTPDMYKKALEFEADYTLVEEYQNNGVIKAAEGIMTSARINALFHSPAIQAHLGMYMGLDVPTNSPRTLMHSVLPGHKDVRPSMGVRWNKENTHLIVRDFSNYFSDIHQQLDYNLVRLYTTIRYKALVPRMKAPEFVVWFLRMLVEAGIIDVSSLRKKYSIPLGGENVFSRVARGFQFLDAIKRLYKGYDNTSTFSDRFCAAWCGIEPSAANRAKKGLVEGSYLVVEGVCDCSGGKRTDGFYNTKIFSIMDKHKIAELNKKRDILIKENNLMKNRHITLRGVSVSKNCYDLINNFCSDYKIGNVPLQKNMFVETGIAEGLVQMELPPSTSSYTIKDLRLVVVPSMKTGKDSVLVLTGESEEIEDLFYSEIEAFQSLDQKVVILSDEPMVGVVISSEIDLEKNPLDIATLELKLKDYLSDELVLDSVFVRYTTSQALFGSILDGKEPDGE
jgi:hypothetical protein